MCASELAKWVGSCALAVCLSAAQATQPTREETYAWLKTVWPEDAVWPETRGWVFVAAGQGVAGWFSRHAEKRDGTVYTLSLRWEYAAPEDWSGFGARSMLEQSEVDCGQLTAHTLSWTVFRDNRLKGKNRSNQSVKPSVWDASVPSSLYDASIARAVCARYLLMARSGDGGTSPPKGATLVRVFFATDREAARDAAARDSPIFGSSRSNAIAYGYCDVSIPFGHRAGDLEEPHWYYLEFNEDATKHIVLANTKTEKAAWFLHRISAALGATTEKKVLLFVHGYNVSFRDAAKRTGQLAFDLDLRGPSSRGIAAFYSWPSQGETIPYDADEANAEWTENHLAQFLMRFLSETSTEHVYVIAHSMGSRPTLRAIAQLSTTHRQLVAKIQGLVLAAPDIDAATFRDQIAPVFGPHQLSGTLYVSSNDVPLGASMRVHGGYPRLGDPAAGPVIVNGIETIDASDVDDGDFLGHSYFAARPALLEDIFSLMNGMAAGQRFGLMPVDAAAGHYWKFKPTAR